MESVTILSAVRKATGHLNQRLIKTMSTQFLAGLEDEIKIATMKGVHQHPGSGLPAGVGADKEIQSTEGLYMVTRKKHDRTKLINFSFANGS